MNYDGWVVIGTDIDSKEFDKEMKKLQKESEKFANEEEKLLNKKAKLEIDTSKAEKDLDNLDSKIRNIKNKLKQEQSNLGNIPSYKVGTPDYNKQSNKVNDLQVQYDSLVAKSDNLNSKYLMQVDTLNDINTKLIENATNQENVKNKMAEIQGKSMGVKLDFDDIGKSIMDNVKKIGKWVGAVFGLRTAYNAVRQAISFISTYNDDIKNKIYSTQMVIASAIEPLITRLVNLAWKLLSYVNYIAKAWFGVDLFAKASANSMKAGANSAKEMKKNLTGFDEATVLNDNGITGASGASTPKFEAPEDVPIPSWIKWIAENKDKVLGIITGLGVAIGGFKIASFLLKLKDIGSGLFGLTKKAGETASGLASFGKMLSTGLIITGLVMIAKAVTDLIFNWNQLTPAQKSADVALLLLGAAFITLGLTIRGAIDTATFGLAEIIGLVTTLALAIGGLITWLFSQEESIKSVDQANKDLKTSQEELKQATDNYVSTLDAYDSALKKVEESARLLEEAEKKNGITGEELFKQVQNGDLTYQDMNESLKEVYRAYMNNQQAQVDLKNATSDLEENTKTLTEAKTKEKLATWEAKLAQDAQNGAFKDGGEKAQKWKEEVVKAYERGELSAKEARDLIGKSMSEMSRDTQKSFTEDLPDAIQEGLDPKKYETWGQKFSKWCDGLWSGITKGASSAWEKVKGWFGNSNYGGSAEFAKGGIVSYGNVYGFAKGGIAYPKLQYCASGAIINQPNRGVPIAQAIGGEAGQEGILPLTNSQLMDSLGESIARHMVINLTNVNQMNGRIISKELKRIDAQQSFVTNG